MQSAYSILNHSPITVKTRVKFLKVIDILKAAVNLEEEIGSVHYFGSFKEIGHFVVSRQEKKNKLILSRFSFYENKMKLASEKCFLKNEGYVERLFSVQMDLTRRSLPNR